MRLSAAEATGSAAPPGQGRGGGFGATLRAAQGRATARELVERRASAAKDRGEAAGRQARERRAAPGEPQRGAAQVVSVGEGVAAPCGEAAGPAGGGPQRAADPAGPPTPAAVLAAAVRGVVPAVEALLRSGREAVSLDLGRALGVEVRAEPGGVALTLAAAPGLSAAARAELPALTRVLAARGIAVVRAEVRPRHAGGGRGR